MYHKNLILKSYVVWSDWWLVIGPITIWNCDWWVIEITIFDQWLVSDWNHHFCDRANTWVLGVRSNPLWNSIVVNEPPLKWMNSPLWSKQPPPPKKSPQLKKSSKFSFLKKRPQFGKKISFLKKTNPLWKTSATRLVIELAFVFELGLGPILLIKRKLTWAFLWSSSLTDIRRVGGGFWGFGRTPFEIL